MDARLHHLQGKAEDVTPSELRRILTDFAADRAALLARHEAAARVMGHYDFNNAYQYVINREETHLSWLQDALAEIEAPLPGAGPVPPVETPKTRSADAAAYRGVLEEDASGLGTFVERWTPRVAELTHARHRRMLQVVLGESLEHKRLFDQAAAGLEDVLGRRTGGVARQGTVLPARWQE
jgi:hypothetical protein